MQPVQITVHGMAHSPALDLLIRQKCSELGQACPRVSGCRVAIDKPPHHKKQGELFDVTIAVLIPGKPEIIINHQHAEDAYVAVRDAFDAAKGKVVELVAAERNQRKGG